MKLTRRQTINLGLGALAVSVASPLLGRQAFAAAEKVDAAIAEFTGGAKIADGKVELGAPEIAENGNTVPVKVNVESEMTADNYVVAVLLLATGNPSPGVATFNFSPMSGEAAASTRIRLARTQDVLAVAKMSDGTFYKDQKTVKVTIGGCGG